MESLIGMKRNLKQTLEIAETASDPKTKLQARAFANDCYRYIMDLCTAGIVSDAIKAMERKRERFDIMQKLEGEKTVNGIFS